MLDWGVCDGKNIYPADSGGGRADAHPKAECDARLSTTGIWKIIARSNSTARTKPASSGVYFGGVLADTFVKTRDNYSSTQGMNTLTAGKTNPRLVVCVGRFTIRSLWGDDFFNQTTTIRRLISTIP